MNNYEQHVARLSKKYGKSTLTLKETAYELSLSINTVRLGIKSGKGIPRYKKVGGGTIRQSVIFSILDVSKFIASSEEVY